MESGGERSRLRCSRETRRNRHDQSSTQRRTASQFQARTRSLHLKVSSCFSADRVVFLYRDFLSFSGMYESPGTWWRICGFANDIVGPKSADKHNLWNPDLRLVLDASDGRFGELGRGVSVLRYNGCMSEDGVAAPHSQPFWTQETPYSNNCFRRCWWPCRYIEWENDHDLCYHSCQWKVDFSKGRRAPTRSPDSQKMA
jgi:hypothetical protein